MGSKNIDVTTHIHVPDKFERCSKIDFALNIIDDEYSGIDFNVETANENQGSFLQIQPEFKLNLNENNNGFKVIIMAMTPLNIHSVVDGTPEEQIIHTLRVLIDIESIDISGAKSCPIVGFHRTIESVENCNINTNYVDGIYNVSIVYNNIQEHCTGIILVDGTIYQFTNLEHIPGINHEHLTINETFVVNLFYDFLINEKNLIGDWNVYKLRDSLVVEKQ